MPSDVHYEAYTKVNKTTTIAIWNHEVGTEVDEGRETHGYGYHIDVINVKKDKVVTVFGAYNTDAEVKAAYNVAVALTTAGRISWEKV